MMSAEETPDQQRLLGSQGPSRLVPLCEAVLEGVPFRSSVWTLPSRDVSLEYVRPVLQVPRSLVGCVY